MDSQYLLPVSLHGCEDYEPQRLREQFDKVLSDLGGWQPYIQPGEKVLLKVNLVSAHPAETAVPTNWVFVQVVAQSLIEYGALIWIGDSPGGLFNSEVLKHSYKVTGMAQAAQNSGARLWTNADAAEVAYPQGKVLKHIYQTAMVAEADKVISLSKLKTHAMMTFTGAVKNQYGTVAGTKKAEYHFQMPDTMQFANALIDINEAAHPVLYFMDGVVGMEGNGPANGDPRKIGVLLGSQSGYCLDAVAASLIGLSVDRVPVSKAAAERGLGPSKVEEVTVLGEKTSFYQVPDFKLPDHIRGGSLVGGALGSLINKMLRPNVTFDPARCVGCQTCVRNCPAHALTMKGKVPSVDHKKCIRCFCCQELCPKDAVRIRQRWLLKVANKL